MVSRPSRRRPAPEPGEVEDPLAADKRTLAIGAAAMVVFVAIGVVSAQLFVTGGCVPLGDTEPSTAEVVAATEVVDAETLTALSDRLEVELTDAVVLPEGTDGLVAAGDGLVATGATTTSLDADLAPRDELTTPGTVVGDGRTLFDLQIGNDLTGQVDAFTPIDAVTLEPGSCTDTQVVSEQFAFLLDARDGRLLQLRLDEDGDLPAAQLRDSDGVVGEVALTLPAGPAGVLGERMTGAIGEDVVVLARRVAPDDDQPPVLVADPDGEVRAEVSRDEVVDAADLDPDIAVRVAVLSVAEDRALLHARHDPAQDDQADDTRSSLVWLDLTDGSLDPLGPIDGLPTAAAAGATDGEVALAFAWPGDARSRATVVGAELADAAQLDGEVRTLRFVGSQPWAITDRGVAVAVPGDPDEAGPQRDLAEVEGVAVRDLAELDGRTFVLVEADGRSIVLAG